MDHECEDAEQDSVPHEIIHEILLRLPVKSLTRFRSISTLWNSTISEPSFAQSHFSRSLHRRSDGNRGATTLLLTFIHKYREERLIFSVKILANRDRSDAPVHQLTISGGYNPNVSQSLGGLICLDLGSICVCNPSTRKFVKLPWTGMEEMAGGSSSSPAFSLHRNYVFGFDPVRNEHKVLDTWVRCPNPDDPYKDLVTEHRVFTIGSNRWRRVMDGLPHFPLDKSVCIDGRIYYGAITSSKNSEDVVFVLVAFDVRGECFNFIKVPNEIGENLEISILMEYEGRPALVDHQGLKDGNKDLAIWVLEDEQEEKWMKNNIGFPVMWSEIKKSPNLDFAGTTHMGELIFAPRNMERPFYVFFFDIKKSTLRKVEIRDMPEFKYNTLIIVRTNDHVESIFSVGVT